MISSPSSYYSSTLYFVILFFSVLSSINSVASTDAPVIGILAQEHGHLSGYVKAFPNYTSHVPASYVKYVEASGARVVPILIGRSPEYYAEILTHINGVLLPGGAAYFDRPNGYADAGRYILRFVEKMNEQGENIPVLAICLGFELILQVSANDTDFRRSCKVQNVNLNLRLYPKYKTSSVFSNADSRYIHSLNKKPITHNNHIWCIERRDMINLKLTEKWNILSNSKFESWNFVSTVEHKTYPFVGLQFHPEKNAFEWTESQHNIHSHDSIISVRIFGDWLIEKAKLNNHSFPSRNSLYESVIQNYPIAMASYPTSLGYEQVYLFK